MTKHAISTKSPEISILDKHHKLALKPVLGVHVTLVDFMYTRRKTFTHEKREQVGMDLVRSTEENRNHTSMHVINTHAPLQFSIHI